MHNGAHFPLCVFTNNARARSKQRAMERAAERCSRQAVQAKGAGKGQAQGARRMQGWYNPTEYYNALWGWGTPAVADNAQAQGWGTPAVADYAHAQGWGTPAVADYAHAQWQSDRVSSSSSWDDGYWAPQGVWIRSP